MLIEERVEGTAVAVRVVPRAGKSQIDGVFDGALRIHLAAAPVEGAANAALIELLAHRFEISKSRVDIISGARSKRKRVLLRGVDASVVRVTLGLE